EIEAKTGTYPSGTYRICLWTECAQPDCNGAGQNAGSIEMPVCIQVNVENPTPLVLAFPTDKSEIDETRPTYTWIPPAPIAGIGGLNYTMTLVEMMDGQSKSDALTMNRPIIDMQGINASTMMHPTDFPELEAGKTYAWQVQAYVGNTFVAKSEQWQFKVKKELKKIDYRYFDLNYSITGLQKFKLDDVVYFTISNDLGSKNPEIKVKELHSKSVNPEIRKVVKDSVNADHDVYSTDLSGSGILKYRMVITPDVFSMNKMYEMEIYFNDKKVLIRFEIAQ
ncbi:MAG TPA: hypothetical protein VGF79_15640, partial [Bacteroidia bacterium]